MMPAERPAGFPYHWIDLGALLAVAGAVVAFGAQRLRGRALVPIHDPELPRARSYDSP